ncbi:MAG: Gfo/Idh/MocA family oxidoreductase [Clostridiales bacterium]|jgi:predicted dehydrogenase|nr:Gfo/Idh/MocA family oxidoreductase [Clostridiales bacterium]
MDTVRYAIIGLGSIAEKHAEAIKNTPGAELAGGYSMVGAEQFAAKHHARIFQTYEEVLASPDVDAVALCTPSGLHTPQALQAMRMGKHVLTEKPMSLTLKEADDLIATQQETGRKGSVISQYRFTPAVEEIKRALALGAFGNVVSGSLQMKYYRSKEYYASGAWRGTWEMDGGGALMNQGIHGIDIFRTLMGAPKQLTGYARTQTHAIEVEDSAVAIVEFHSGAVGTIEGSTTCFPGYPRRIEICGDKGSVVLEEDAILRWDLPIPCTLTVGTPAQNVASSDPMAISSVGHTKHYINFTRAILYDEPILADFRAGREPLEIILAIYASSKEGKSISLRDFA